jgi:hypothetical protein
MWSTSFIIKGRNEDKPIDIARNNKFNKHVTVLLFIFELINK